MRIIKKIIWYIQSLYAKIKYPIDNSLPYLGVTGTDGKTTTSMYLYEIAKSCGYRPLVITTVGTMFDDNFEPIELKSTSYLSYSLKQALKSLKKFEIKSFIKNILLLNKEEYKQNKETHRTTPLASEIRQIIRKYINKSANLIIIECTSHALDQFRVNGIYFDSVVFTNITNEHLDYHGTWTNYANAKAKLAKQVKNSGTICLNYNDSKSYDFLQKKIRSLNKQKIIYWVKDLESLNLQKFFIEIKQKPNNIIEIIASPYKTKNSYMGKINLFGEYNIYNAMAAFACFYGFNNQNIDNILKGIENLSSIPGRMEIINSSPRVIVDFAHTPNAMENALKSVKNTIKKGNLWVIFGCAGDRYKEKRPEMGKIAFKYGDRIIITTEDPRNENPIEINNQILEGIKEIINKNIDYKNQVLILTYHKDLKYNNDISKLIVRFDKKDIKNRKNAIKFAIKNANSQDTIIILGKGHETTFAIDDKEYKWNDIEVTKKILEKV